MSEQTYLLASLSAHACTNSLRGWNSVSHGCVGVLCADSAVPFRVLLTSFHSVPFRSVPRCVVVNEPSGDSTQKGTSMEIPFQKEAMQNHHSMSERNSQLRRMRDSKWRRVVDRSITLRTNALPGLITFAACCRDPRREEFPFCAAFASTPYSQGFHKPWKFVCW